LILKVGRRIHQKLVEGGRRGWPLPGRHSASSSFRCLLGSSIINEYLSHGEIPKILLIIRYLSPFSA
jgi:hypothetical protein